MNLIEQLAELEHEQWLQWAESIVTAFGKCEGDSEACDGCADAKICKKIVRWESECFMPYSELSEKMKEHDREWARKVIGIINQGFERLPEPAPERDKEVF